MTILLPQYVINKILLYISNPVANIIKKSLYSEQLLKEIYYNGKIIYFPWRFNMFKQLNKF